MRREEPVPQESGFGRLAALLAVAFVVTLGVVIGTRMSSDAIAVLVGVIAGVAASIPTALLIMAVTRRREPEYEDDYEEQPRQTMPQVIVVAPGAAPQQQLPGLSGYPYAQVTAPPRRQFRVMGQDDLDDEVVEGNAQRATWDR